MHLWVRFTFEVQFPENFGEKTRKCFHVEPFFCMSYMKCLSKYPYSKKYPCSPQKIPGLAPVTVTPTFHPNCHPNICVAANLPIYRKLNHYIIILAFLKPRILCLVLFWRRHKIFALETLVSVILKKIYIIFIFKYWHYNLC